jgi:hypothetical protein
MPHRGEADRRLLEMRAIYRSAISMAVAAKAILDRCQGPSHCIARPRTARQAMPAVMTSTLVAGRKTRSNRLNPIQARETPIRKSPTEAGLFHSDFSIQTSHQFWRPYQSFISFCARSLA